MPYYWCLLTGENFRFREGGEVKLMGFSTSRWVEADGPEEAEELAVMQLRAEPVLARPDWYDGAEPQPSVHLEEVTEVSASDVRAKTGFAFFPMEE
jgi:hypothetical protein